MSETLGGYVRHRDRMVQASVFEDLQNTLIACRWMPGTTTREVYDPTDNQRRVVTIASSQVYRLLGGYPLVLIDYFPEAEGDTATAPALNTLALSNGVPGDPAYLEMGSSTVEQPYVFNLAFYASSDAVAAAVLSDLRDRYLGRIVADDTIELFDYNANPDTPVTRMEVDTFRYTQNTEEVNVPAEVHLYFAELAFFDFVD